MLRTLIEQNVARARALAHRVDAEPELQRYVGRGIASSAVLRSNRPDRCPSALAPVDRETFRCQCGILAATPR